MTNQSAKPNPAERAAMKRFAGPKCKSYEPGCFACAAWNVMESWFENEQPALIAQERRAAVEAFAEKLKNIPRHQNVSFDEKVMIMNYIDQALKANKETKL